MATYFEDLTKAFDTALVAFGMNNGIQGRIGEYRRTYVCRYPISCELYAVVRY
uniref:Uncharacterized protein n=1 Tax=Salmonella phage vB_SE126_2P TaxID=3236704 RepID=A0AB39C3V7_9VIRU